MTVIIPSNLYKLSLILKDIEEGHLLIENCVNIFVVTSLSVPLHNLLDFYNLFCSCCIVMSRRSVTHEVLWLVDSLRLYIYRHSNICLQRKTIELYIHIPVTHNLCSWNSIVLILAFCKFIKTLYY